MTTTTAPPRGHADLDARVADLLRGVALCPVPWCDQAPDPIDDLGRCAGHAAAGTHTEDGYL
jgi:hypothetical protein